MKASSWRWRILCAAGVVLGLCLAGPGWADDKKDTARGKDDTKVIIIQLDASKVSPDVLKKFLEMSRSTGKDEDKKPAQREDKKPAPMKDDGKKPNIVQVDLNKLSPDLARRLTAELAQSKEGKKSDKKDDEGDKKKKDRKKDDEDDGKKKGGQKKDD